MKVFNRKNSTLSGPDPFAPPQNSISADYMTGFGSRVSEEERERIKKEAALLGDQISEWAKKASIEELGRVEVFNNCIRRYQELDYAEKGLHDPRFHQKVSKYRVHINQVLWEKLKVFFLPDS